MPETYTALCVCDSSVTLKTQVPRYAPLFLCPHQPFHIPPRLYSCESSGPHPHAPAVSPGSKFHGTWDTTDLASSYAQSHRHFFSNENTVSPFPLAFSLTSQNVFHQDVITPAQEHAKKDTPQHTRKKDLEGVSQGGYLAVGDRLRLSPPQCPRGYLLGSHRPPSSIPGDCLMA